MRRLSIADALLYSLDFVFDVAVGDQDIEPAVVVVKEKAAEAQRDQCGAADFGARRFVHEQAVAFVVVERKHLIREVGDDQASVSGAVVVGGIHAHSRAGDAVFTERDAGGHGALFKRAIFFVQVELVGLGVVGDDDIGPAVVVVIKNGNAQTLRGWIVESGLL